MSGLAQWIGSLLSWLHQLPPDVCPGAWPWTVTLAGVLLASSPVLGALLIASVRKVTGNNYSMPVVLTFGAFGLVFGLLVPWLFAALISNVLEAAAAGNVIGLTPAAAAALNNPVCSFGGFFGGMGRQGHYLSSGPTGYEALMPASAGPVSFWVFILALVAVPAACLVAVIMQARLASRRGPGWPGRLLWLPFVAFAVFSTGLQARVMAQFWLGFLPASVAGVMVVASFGPPSWSVINRPRREPTPAVEPKPAPPPYEPPPRQVAKAPPMPTRVDLSAMTSAPPAASPAVTAAANKLANTPGPLPFGNATTTAARWNSAGGRFRRVRQLGHGGFGTVWLAVDTQLDRTVALKFAHAPDPQTQQRMLREARALAAVQHPNCVRVYDVIADTDGLGIVMEYIDGRPLSDVHAGSSSLDDVAAARLWATLAGALSEAHRKGVVHRDVKPGNVLLDADGVAHLIDFGIAKAKGDVTLTAVGMMVGTPDFLAPETAASGVATPASDAWQLAATVSYAMTGQPPRGYRANPMSALMAAAQRLPNTHLPQRSRHLPLLTAALDPDPARRPTLATVQRELGSWLAGGGHAEDGPVTTLVAQATQVQANRPGR